MGEVFMGASSGRVKRATGFVEKLASGAVTSTTTRTINLGFRPDLVLISPDVRTNGYAANRYAFLITNENNHSSQAYLTDTGFALTVDKNYGAYYLAIKF